MTKLLGASPHERSEERIGYRAGYYRQSWITRVGKIELSVPQDSSGQFSMELFDRYQRSEKALFSVLAEMYVPGSLDPLGQDGDGGPVWPWILGLHGQRHQQDARCSTSTLPGTAPSPNQSP